MKPAKASQIPMRSLETWGDCDDALEAIAAHDDNFDGPGLRLKPAAQKKCDAIAKKMHRLIQDSEEF